MILIMAALRKDATGGDENQQERTPHLGEETAPLMHRIHEVGRHLHLNHPFLLRRVKPVCAK